MIDNIFSWTNHSCLLSLIHDDISWIKIYLQQKSRSRSNYRQPKKKIKGSVYLYKFDPLWAPFSLPWNFKIFDRFSVGHLETQHICHHFCYWFNKGRFYSSNSWNCFEVDEQPCVDQCKAFTFKLWFLKYVHFMRIFWSIIWLTWIL